MKTNWKKLKFVETHCRIREIDLSYRADIFLRIYALKKDDPAAWKEYKRWIKFLIDNGRSLSIPTELRRLRQVYASIKGKGYSYPWKDQRDVPIISIYNENKFHIFNGASRLSSMMILGIDSLMMRVADNVKAHRQEMKIIREAYDLDEGAMMKCLSKEAKDWIREERKQYCDA